MTPADLLAQNPDHDPHKDAEVLGNVAVQPVRIV